MSATCPARLPGARGVQASAALDVVPVRPMGKVPSAGGGPAPEATVYPIGRLSGEMVKAVRFTWVFRNDATPITFFATPGALAE